MHTNPLNRDPLVREAYVHFYNLDYPGAVERFERFHDEHPGDPQATALLLNAVLFQELYRLDLLDTTFYANDGFSNRPARDGGRPKDSRPHSGVLPMKRFTRRIGGWARIPTTWMRCMPADGRAA